MEEFNPAQFYEEHAGAGTGEGMGLDARLPGIQLASSGSEVLKPSNQERYIEGIKHGDMYNSQTNEILGDEISVVVCDFVHRYELKAVPGQMPATPYPNDRDFLYRGQGTPSDWKRAVSSPKFNRDTRELSLSDGSQGLVFQTLDLIVLLQGDEGWSPARIVLRRTKLELARQLRAFFGGQEVRGARGLYTPPSFYWAVKIRSAERSSARMGNSWLVYDFAGQAKPLSQVLDGALFTEVAQKAVETYKNSQRVQAELERLDTPGANASLPAPDDGIPFMEAGAGDAPYMEQAALPPVSAYEGEGSAGGRVYQQQTPDQQRNASRDGGGRSW